MPARGHGLAAGNPWVPGEGRLRCGGRGPESKDHRDDLSPDREQALSGIVWVADCSFTGPGLVPQAGGTPATRAVDHAIGSISSMAAAIAAMVGDSKNETRE